MSPDAELRFDREERIGIALLVAIVLVGGGLAVYLGAQPEGPCEDGIATPFVTMVGGIAVNSYICEHSTHTRHGMVCACPR